MSGHARTPNMDKTTATDSALAMLPWESQAKTYLTRFMKIRNVGYKELSRRLEKLGIHESPGQINRKMNRQRFSAAFFLACCRAMDVQTLIFDVEPPHNRDSDH